ncbi:MAG: hypothetical protein IT355_14170 [Gemmatimonadaceae bacterium]|nr:hypothetical protein [Gemmatimonadaceae bacterium]
MSIAITRDTFSDDDYARFAARLAEQVAHLARTCRRPGFGDGPATIGAELELPLVGPDWCPQPCNLAVLAELADPRATVEIARFNLELNLTPQPAAGTPFTALGAEMHTLLHALGTVAARHDARVLPIGILPSVRHADVTHTAMTDLPRYRALERAVTRLRGAPAHIRIVGEEPLAIEDDGVMLEGANTSFQVHLRVPASEYADTYNAAQLATIIAVGVGGNSPVFLDHLLWDETRIAVFKQSVDARTAGDLAWHRPARVAFGHGWVRRSAHELFADAVRMHPPIFPVCDDEEDAPDAPVPRLAELRLHLGTVWRWNRAIYDCTGDGHLRIEFRALPGGPTVTDMLASAAYMLGLTVGLRDDIDMLVHGMPFALAETSFYRAARDGIDARILWPAVSGVSPQECNLRTLALALLPVAERGLTTLGVDAGERTRLLGVIADRVTTGQTGARWQRNALHALRAYLPRPAALAALVAAYAARADTGAPVHTWSPV